MHRKNPLQPFSETRLKKDEEDDCWDMLDKIPMLMISHDTFVSMVLSCPAKIELSTLNWEMTDELQFLMINFWLPAQQTSYTWLKAVGYCPWYWESVRGTEHRIPVVCPRNSGYCTTYLDTKHRQQFAWHWNDAKTMEADKNVYIITARHAPGLDGSIRSPIASLLYEWRTTRIVRTSTEIATDQQAHQQHVFEFHPAKTGNGDDNLQTLESFGDKIAGTVLSQQESLYAAKSSMRVADLHHSLASAAAYNRGMRRSSAVLRSESQSDQWERENANILERGVPLKPDFNYKPVPPPRITTSLPELSLRLEKLASAIMDIPYQLIESSGGRTSANVQGSFRLVNERLKDWNAFFERLTKKWFLMAYGETIQEGLDDENRKRRALPLDVQEPHKMLKLYADTEVNVYMSRTPIANVQDIVNLHLSGYMKKKTAAEHAFSILGLSHADISISDYPDRMPQPPPPAQKKRKTIAADDVPLV